MSTVVHERDAFLANSFQIQACCFEAGLPRQGAPREALCRSLRQAFLQGTCYLYAIAPRHLPYPTNKFVTDMLSGPITAMVWEGRDAVKTGRSKSNFFAMLHSLTGEQPFSVPPTLSLPPLAPSEVTMPLMSAAMFATVQTVLRTQRKRSLCGSSPMRSKATRPPSSTGSMRRHR